MLRLTLPRLPLPHLAQLRWTLPRLTLLHWPVPGWPRPQRLLLLLTLLTALTAAGCANAEFDQVRAYKEFLSGAKPSLEGMNKVRREMMDHSDGVDTLLVKFEVGLLPHVQALQQRVEEHPAPAGRLGEIHSTFKKIMVDYLAATKQLVERTKAAKAKSADDEIERAILDWGAKDKLFGEQMGDENQGLVRDLTEYLEQLKS